MNIEELFSFGSVAFLVISLFVISVLSVCFIVWATVISAADAVAAVNAARKKER